MWRVMPVLVLVYGVWTWVDGHWIIGPGSVLIALVMARVDVVWAARDRALAHPDVHDKWKIYSAPFWPRFLNLRKWTFEQFYPELGRLP